MSVDPAQSSTLVPAADDEVPIFGTTLKLRLSLLITALLAIVTLAGGAYVVQKARTDTREEAQSTVALTGHFLDAQLEVLHDHWASAGYSAPHFRLRELGNIRHLNVRFYDAQNRLVDSNEEAGSRVATAPRWFASMIPIASAPLQSETRSVSYDGRTVGRLVIAPDPSYETDEMWETCRGLLSLLLSFFVLVNALVWWAAARAMRPVEHILRALEELRRGNLSARLPPLGLPELSRISVGFNHMAETLEHSVTDNQRLTRRLLKTQESERTRLARELHDEIGQCVSAIHADAAAIRNRGGESVRESAEAIVEVTGHLKQIVRSMLQRLRPPVLEDLGLTPALRELVAGFQQRNPEVICTLKVDGELEKPDGEVGIAIYRITQECLTNIAVHAGAQHAVVEVGLSGDGIAGGVERQTPSQHRSSIRLTVADDGVGFSPKSGVRGFGLRGIRERVKGLGGTCEIDARPGRGTRIAVDIPLPSETDAVA